MEKLVSLIFAFLSCFASATSTQSKIEFVQVNNSESNPVASIKLSTPASTRPECASSNKLVFNPATPIGSSILSIAMAAKAAEREIFVFGTDNCSLTGDKETIAYIRLL